MESVLEILHETNRYFSEAAPWKLTHEQESQKRRIIGLTFESLRICSILLSPIMPGITGRVLNLLGVPKDERLLEHARLGHLLRLSDYCLPPLEPFFPKLEE